MNVQGSTARIFGRNVLLHLHAFSLRKKDGMTLHQAYNDTAHHHATFAKYVLYQGTQQQPLPACAFIAVRTPPIVMHIGA
jgi:hypothetical protein